MVFLREHAAFGGAYASQCLSSRLASNCIYVIVLCSSWPGKGEHTFFFPEVEFHKPIAEIFLLYLFALVLQTNHKQFSIGYRVKNVVFETSCIRRISLWPGFCTEK